MYRVSVCLDVVRITRCFVWNHHTIIITFVIITFVSVNCSAKWNNKRNNEMMMTFWGEPVLGASMKTIFKYGTDNEITINSAMFYISNIAVNIIFFT